MLIGQWCRHGHMIKVAGCNSCSRMELADACLHACVSVSTTSRYMRIREGLSAVGTSVGLIPWFCKPADDRLPGGAGLRAMLNSAEQAWLAEGGAYPLVHHSACTLLRLHGTSLPADRPCSGRCAYAAGRTHMISHRSFPPLRDKHSVVARHRGGARGRGGAARGSAPWPRRALGVAGAALGHGHPERDAGQLLGRRRLP